MTPLNVPHSLHPTRNVASSPTQRARRLASPRSGSLVGTELLPCAESRESGREGRSVLRRRRCVVPARCRPDRRPRVPPWRCERRRARVQTPLHETDRRSSQRVDGSLRACVPSFHRVRPGQGRCSSSRLRAQPREARAMGPSRRSSRSRNMASVAELREARRWRFVVVAHGVSVELVGGRRVRAPRLAPVSRGSTQPGGRLSRRPPPGCCGHA